MNEVYSEWHGRQAAAQRVHPTASHIHVNHSFIIVLDANKLDAWAMKAPLNHKGPLASIIAFDATSIALPKRAPVHSFHSPVMSLHAFDY